MNTAHEQFARQLVAYLLTRGGFEARREQPEKILLARQPAERQTQRQWMSLDMTPFAAQAGEADAASCFEGVEDADGLLQAYQRARAGGVFEQDVPQAMAQVSAYAGEFLDGLLHTARAELRDDEARRIAAWVKNFDRYVAVKCVESLLNSRADRALLDIAAEQGWDIHFDHLAIRCGCNKTGDAKRITDMLIAHHGYSAPQMHEQYFYRFDDGWDAYVVYKILRNGQVLRLFIDESDAAAPAQVIQHWNHVYGYTAHHLGIRATRWQGRQRIALSLDEIMPLLRARGIECLTPTGEYTRGLLQQVFTRPEQNTSLPEALRRELAARGAGLENVLRNGKLLEVVSRAEMPHELAQGLFDLYGLSFQPGDPLHSAPLYHYFLPAQAAHVIRSSVQLKDGAASG